MIPLLLCGMWLSHFKKTNGHNKSSLPWGRGMVFKWCEMNTVGVSIKNGFLFFLKQYICGLFLKVCLIFHLAVLIALFSTLSHIESSDFSIFCFLPCADWGGSEAWATSTWDSPVGTSSARLMQWEGGDRAVLFPSGSKCNEKLLWNYQLRHLKQFLGCFLCYGGSNP